jgi:hypothetical protein
MRSRFAELFCHCRAKEGSRAKEEAMTDITPDFKAMQDNVRRFWDTQDRLLDNMEKFADGWFKRRHVASHAAQEAARYRRKLVMVRVRRQRVELAV